MPREGAACQVCDFVCEKRHRREKKSKSGRERRIRKELPGAGPGDVVKSQDEGVVLRSQEFDVVGLELAGLERPEDAHALLPVNHLVHANKAVHVGAQIASAVFD